MFSWSRLTPLALILFLSACGPQAPLHLNTMNSDDRAPDEKFFDSGLSGTSNDEGVPYTNYITTNNQQQFDSQVTQNTETENFAKQLLGAESEINENHLKVSVSWAGVSKPLIFDGYLQLNEGFLKGELQDSSGQRSDLKLKATCADQECTSINAFVEDAGGHRAAIHMNKKNREMELIIPEAEQEKFKKLPVETQNAINEIKNTKTFTHSSVVVNPGRSYLEITSPDGGILRNELVQTNDAPVPVMVTGGSFEKAGKITMIGNTETGSVLYQIENRLPDAPPADPTASPEDDAKNVVRVLFETPLPEFQQEVQLNPMTTLPLPGPQTSKPSKTPLSPLPLSQNPTVPPTTPSAPVTPIKPVTPPTRSAPPPAPVAPTAPSLPIQSTIPAGAHRLVSQILKDATNRLVLNFIAAKYSPPARSNNMTKKIEKYLDLYDQSRGENLSGVAADVKKMKIILRNNDQPSWMLWTVGVESNFNPAAVGSSDDVGYWQITPIGADEVKLPLSDRTSTTKATEAAAKLLNNKLSEFKDDIKFALAAYNAGKGGVQKASKSVEATLSKSRGFTLEQAKLFSSDFWNIYEFNLAGLKRSTKEYVMKIIAGDVCSFNPPQCGFSDKKPVDLN